MMFFDNAERELLRLEAEVVSKEAISRKEKDIALLLDEVI